MKRLSAAAIALSLAACATPVITSNPGFYRPKGSDDQATITASIEREGRIGARYNLAVQIDGQPAASGVLTGGVGQVVGTWQGRKVEADCTAGSADSGIIDGARAIVAGMDTNTIRCMVFVAGERAAVLTMAPK